MIMTKKESKYRDDTNIKSFAAWEESREDITQWTSDHPTASFVNIDNFKKFDEIISRRLKVSTNWEEEEVKLIHENISDFNWSHISVNQIPLIPNDEIYIQETHHWI